MKNYYSSRPNASLPSLPFLLFCFWLAGCAGEKSDAELAEENNVVEESKAALTVETVEVRRGDVTAWIFSEGTARSVRREYLNFENPGRIDYLQAGLKEGSVVKAGEVLVRQDQRRVKADLVSARASLTEAKAQVDVAQAEHVLALKNLARYESLVEKNSASTQELEEAQIGAEKAQVNLRSAQAQVASIQASVKQNEIALEQTQLASPIDGIVSRLNIDTGYYFTPSLVRTDSESSLLQTVPLVIIDPTQYEILVDIAVQSSEQIQAGQAVLVRAGGAGQGREVVAQRQAQSALKSDQYSVTGEVYSVTPSISPEKRAAQVKIRTKSGGENLQDGMFVTVWIAMLERNDVLVAPFEAFIFRDNKPYVYVVEKVTNLVRQRAVTLGVAGVNDYEVVAGVGEGDTLVTAGRYQLTEGAVVRKLASASKAARSQGE